MAFFLSIKFTLLIVMVDLWFALNVFQEELLLEECLQNIRSNAPWAKIVAVDGSYLTFYQEARVLAAQAFRRRYDALGEEYMRLATGPSTDRTLQILKDFKVEQIIETPRGLPWPREHTKRSQYLQVAKPGDWLFILDADERLSGKVPTVQELEDGGSLDYCVMLRRDDDPPSAPYPVLRVHKHTGEYLRYRKAHHHLWRGDKIVYKPDLEDKIIHDLIVEHRWRYRAEITPHRHRTKGSYYVRLLDQIEGIARATEGF